MGIEQLTVGVPFVVLCELMIHKYAYSRFYFIFVLCSQEKEEKVRNLFSFSL
jgi:hypothetical protein